MPEQTETARAMVKHWFDEGVESWLADPACRLDVTELADAAHRRDTVDLVDWTRQVASTASRNRPDGLLISGGKVPLLLT